MKFLNKLRKSFKYPYIFDKRQRFATQTILLTAGILITQLIWEDYRFFMVGVLSIFCYLLTIWSLLEDIKGVEWLLLFILPVFFTIAVSLFYFLLPVRMLSRLIIASVFAVGMYAILLIENINNVAAERSIQLVRAAQSVGLLITSVTIFLLANILYSLRLIFWQNMMLTFFFSLFLALQSLWSIKLEAKISASLLIYSAIVSLCLSEMAFGLSFWPIQNASYSLLITATFYALIGIFQQYLSDRFFINTIREYILVFIFTLFLALFTTSWNG